MAMGLRTNKEVLGFLDMVCVCVWGYVLPRPGNGVGPRFWEVAGQGE